MASSLVARRQSSFFRAFLPRAAVRALVAARSAGRLPASAANATELLATETEAAILVVDISGFTRLCDRFQALGPGGVDALTACINRVFGVLLAHIAAWGGDVVRFVGDALIVMWEAGPAAPGLAAAVARATCARELERLHGTFEVRVPAAAPPPLADQICRYVAAVGCNAISAGGGGGVTGADARDLDILDRLRSAPGLLGVSEAAVRQLAAVCACCTVRTGTVIAEQGASADYVHVLHAGECQISHTDPECRGAAATSRSYVREGAAVGLEEALNGKPYAAAAVAARSCVVLRLPAAAVRLALSGPGTGRAGAGGGLGNRAQMAASKLVRSDSWQARSGESDTLTLRIHQVLSPFSIPCCFRAHVTDVSECLQWI